MKTIPNSSFFDAVALYYDKMIDYDTAVKRKVNALRYFKNGKTNKAADLGCGTGIDSIALAQNNWDVTGFDNSKKMIDAACKNAITTNLDIKFFNYSIDKIPSSFHNSFSFIVSLGNTFANLNLHQLEKAIIKTFNLLDKDGLFLVQILNFDLICEKKERIINITQDQEYYYIRFYDFINDYLNFNILKFSKSNFEKRELLTTKLFPHSSELLKNKLEICGFRKITLYSSLYKSEFVVTESKDLVILAKK